MAALINRSNVENIMSNAVVGKENMVPTVRKAFANLANIDGRTDRVPRKVRSAASKSDVDNQDFDMDFDAISCTERDCTGRTDEDKRQMRLVFITSSNILHCSAIDCICSNVS